jgi:HEAT repeat protein
MRTLGRFLLFSAILAVSAGAAHAEDYLFFKILDVQKGAARASVLFPHLIHFESALSEADLLSGLTQEMARGREAVYAKLSIQAAAGGAVDVRFVEQPAPEYFPALAEIYYSLRFNGFKEVRFLLPDGNRMPWGSQPYPVFLPVVNTLGTLDPSPFPETVVTLGEGRWMSGNDFNRLRGSNPAEIKASFANALANDSPLVKLYLLERLDRVPLADLEGSLIKLLSDPSPVIRLKAIELLRDRRSPAVVAALEKVVDQDPDPEVKTRAVVVLDGLGITKYHVFILFDKLRSSNESEVLDAMNQLIASGDPKVLVGIAPLLGSSNDSIRGKAVEGVVKFNDTRTQAASLERADVPQDVKERFALALADSSFRDLKLKGLTWLLESGAEPRKVEALQRIGATRELALTDKVLAALDATQAEVVKAAAAVLAAFKEKKALDKLADTGSRRGDVAPEMEAAVITVMASLPLDEVIGLARSNQFTLRRLATKSLAEFMKSSSKPNPKVTGILEERLADSNIEIKRAAVYALARAKAEPIVGKLMGLVDDPDNEVREQVMVAVNALPPAGAADLVVKKLDDPFDPVKYQAVLGVRALKVKAAVPKLKWMVKYGNVDIRREVIGALAGLMDPEEQKRDFELFSEALYDQDPAIKTTAMTTLANIRDPRVAPTLSSLVLDQDKEVKLKALESLGRTCDPAAVEYIVQGLFDLDNTVKKAALDSLRTLHVEVARKPLQEFIRNESDAGLRAFAEQVYDSLP